MKHHVIKINLLDARSIARGEAQKTRYENAGKRLIESVIFDGSRRCNLVYVD